MKALKSIFQTYSNESSRILHKLAQNDPGSDIDPKVPPAKTGGDQTDDAATAAGRKYGPTAECARGKTTILQAAPGQKARHPVGNQHGDFLWRKFPF
jgi:hypothetical protein